MARHSTAAIVLLTLCTTSAAGASSPRGSRAKAATTTPITLTFDWRAGDTAQVREVQSQRWLLTSGATNESRHVMTHTLTVESRPEGFRIRSSDVKLHEDQPIVQLVMEMREELELVVSPDGAFRSISTTEQILEKLDDRMASAPHFARMSVPERNGTRDFIRGMVAGDDFPNIVSAEWKFVVEPWIGVQLVPGKIIERVGSSWTPTTNVACSPADREKRCVLLVAESPPNPQTEEATRAYLRQAALADGKDTDFGSFKLSNTMRLLIEPTTLRPVRFEVIEKVRATIARNGGKMLPVEFDKVRDTTWTWKPRATDEGPRTSAPPAAAPPAAAPPASTPPPAAPPTATPPAADAKAAQKAAPSEPTTIHLQFGWKPGMFAKVAEEHITRGRLPDGTTEENRTTIESLRGVVAFPQGMVVGTSDVKVAGRNLNPTDVLLAEIDEDFQRVISPEGELLGFTNTALLPERLDARLDADPQFKRLPESSRTQYRAVMHQMAHPRLLQSISASDWISTIGQWTGKTLTIGEYEIEDRVKRRIVKRARCVPTNMEKRCVELEAEVTPSSEDLATARDGLRQMAAAMNDPTATVGELEIVNRVRVLLEPAGMRIHEVEMQSTTRCTIKRGDRESVPVMLEDIRIQEWTWNKLPGPSGAPPAPALP